MGGELSVKGVLLGGQEAGGLGVSGWGCGGGRARPERPLADRTHLPAIAGPGVTLPPSPGFGGGGQALAGSRYKVFCPASPWLPGLRGPSEGQCRRGGGGNQMPVGPPAANTNTASRFQPPSPVCPTFPLARPPPSREAASARPGAAGRGQGGRPPLLSLCWQDPPEAW